MRYLAAALALVSCACGASGADPEAARDDAPTVFGLRLTSRVVDAADVLAPPIEQALERKLAHLEAQTTDQMVVVTIPSLKGRRIEQVGLELGRGWGLGRADNDNGVLILVAPRDRKVRIEVGYGLEALLTDQRAAKTISLMLPHFRAGDVDRAVTAGVDDLDSLLRSDRRRPQYRSGERRKAA